MDVRTASDELRHRLPAFHDRFLDFPNDIREEMIARCEGTMKRRLDELPYEIARLQDPCDFPEKRRRLMDVVEAARRVGLDVGPHERRIAELDEVILRHRAAVETRAQRWTEMELLHETLDKMQAADVEAGSGLEGVMKHLRTRLAMLEEEEEEEEAMPSLPVEFHEVATAPWYETGFVAADVNVSDDDDEMQW